MATIRDNAKVWDKILILSDEASEHYDLEKAQELAKKYNFHNEKGKTKTKDNTRDKTKVVKDKKENIHKVMQERSNRLKEMRRFNRNAPFRTSDERSGWYAVSPNGEKYYEEFAQDLAKAVGLSVHSIQTLCNSGRVLVGRHSVDLDDGWKFYRVFDGQTNERLGEFVKTDIPRHSATFQDGKFRSSVTAKGLANTMNMTTKTLNEAVNKGEIVYTIDYFLDFIEEEQPIEPEEKRQKPKMDRKQIIKDESKESDNVTTNKETKAELASDAIQPNHYRQGEIDLIEAWEKLFPAIGYRYAMKSHIMKYVFRYDFKNGVQDLDKASEHIERLKKFEEKKIDEVTIVNDVLEDLKNKGDLTKEDYEMIQRILWGGITDDKEI